MRTKIVSCLVLSFLFCFKGFCQLDSIYFHKGEVKVVNVTKIGEQTVTYKYPNEETENDVSKYALQKVVIGKSGRVENMSDKIVINGEDDWEKVIILDNIAQTVGLKKVDEVAGKTALINYRTATGSDKKSLEKLKKAAAKKGAAFIIINADKNFNLGYGWGSNQSAKKGVCYTY